jgi:hypothetical protein
MTTPLLERIAPNLAINAVAAPLAIYGLHRMFPVPNVGFLAIASAMMLCTRATIVTLGTDYAAILQDKYNTRLFYRLNQYSAISLEFLLPIFTRYVGQRLGIEVPGYLQTVAYIDLAGLASFTVRNTYETLRATYNSYYPKPAKT